VEVEMLAGLEKRVNSSSSLLFNHGQLIDTKQMTESKNISTIYALLPFSLIKPHNRDY
jgi:hypothetical protein